MRLEFTVRVELERQHGLFASRDELAEQIVDALETANPDELIGDNDGEYTVTLWEVEVSPVERRSRRERV